MKNVFRIGTSGWSYAHWRNKFYPPQCPATRWLEFYTQYFDTVELNATFYRFFKKEAFQSWYQRVPTNFKYVVKAPSYITHRKQLLDATAQINSFCLNAKFLKQKLGLILLQLSPRTPYDLSRLEDKLKVFGHLSKKLVVEFRHEKWLTDDNLTLLKKYQATFCNVDSTLVRLQTNLTSPIGYIRLHGRQEMYNYCYSSKELAEIAEQAKTLQHKGARTVYIFFNNDANAHSIKNALTLKYLLQGGT